MDAIIQAVAFVLDLVIPDEDRRFRRVQRIGCVLFGGFALLVGGYAFIVVFVIGNR
jgi:hypothetical protein